MSRPHQRVAQPGETPQEFALRAADALAATLNLRRTLGRLAHLAVPRFGDWAGVTLIEPAHLRQATCGPTGDLGESRRRLRDLGPDVLDTVRDAATGHARSMPATAELLQAFGCTAGDAATVLQHTPDACLTVLRMPAQSAEALLAVAGAGTPPADELVALARRGGVALTAAHVFDERATLAETLRAALVPAPLPSIEGLDLAASYRPAQETTQIGGDFYDVLPRSDGSWALSVGDVCGKGVDAAVLTGQVRQSLRTAGLVTDDPARTLHLLNEAMLAGGGDNFVTVVHGVLRRLDGTVTMRIAAGGHPPPLVLRGGEVERVPVRGTIVGMLPSVSFDAVDVTLRPGELLLVYTDGVTEARGEFGMLGLKPLEKLLADCDDLPAAAVTERAMQLVLEHLDGRPHDDIAIVALRCVP